MTAGQDEVNQNYEAFLKLLPTLLATHRDKYALMKGGKILGFFSTAQDARSAANLSISDKIYSIQLVSNTAINVGYYTNALVIN